MIAFNWSILEWPVSGTVVLTGLIATGLIATGLIATGLIATGLIATGSSAGSTPVCLALGRLSYRRDRIDAENRAQQVVAS